MVIIETTYDAVEIDVDDVVDEATGVRYIGKARRQDDGSWRSMAVVGGSVLCLVEVSVRPMQHINHDPGDEDHPRRRVW